MRPFIYKSTGEPSLAQTEKDYVQTEGKPGEHQGEAGPFSVKLLMPGSEQTLSVAATQNIWDAARAAGIILPAMCHQGRCLTCAGQVVGPPGATGVDQSASDRYLPADRQANFVLLCTGKPRANLEIRTHQQDEMRANRVRQGLPAPYA